MDYDFVQLLNSNDTWSKFEADWREQCANYGEAFEDYSSGTFSIVKEVIDNEKADAGVFAFLKEKKHLSMCQLNVAMLPGYDSPVLRTRFLTLCPDLDFGDNPVDDYIDALVHAFAGIIVISDSVFGQNVKHIKFHLRSPADRQFFSTLGSGLNERDEFASVKTAGSWLYVTKS